MLNVECFPQINMAERAQVTSVEAVEAFRADLIVYLSKVRAAVEEASDEVQRTRLWVQHDQRRLWQGEMRVRYRKLEEAKAELFSARLSQFHEATDLRLMTMQRAERAQREAEAKLAVLKKWDRELESHTDPLVKQVTQFHSFLTTDMGRATAYLAQAVRALEAYAGIPTPGGGAPATAAKNQPADEGETPP
jgi:hypothetical protein